jgi:serine/threonine protein kinase/tetratricopeptide (TPR) repeat protein
MIPETISHYRIIKRLGAGGMGEVYLAEDTRLGRQVAIKLLPANLIGDQNAEKRFLREAQAAAGLDHPNICAIHEVNQEAGYNFIVMQYIEGETLAGLMARKTLTIEETLEIAVQVADALVEAHSRGIVHRDIKPMNIMWTARGQAKVLDFGLAKVVDPTLGNNTEAMTASLLSQPGAVLGTIPYMSPEQVRGEVLDARTDIFSLGVVLYEMVCGVQPFLSESSAGIISSILNAHPPPLARYSREVPAELERIVSKAIAKKRDERYQTSRDLLIDLRNLKQQTEFEQQLERSLMNDPGSSGAVPALASAARGVRSTASVGAERTDQAREVSTSGDSIARRQIDRRILIGGVLLLVVVAVAGYLLLVRGSGTIDSVAVLPFEDKSNDPDSEYLADGITDSIINSLSQLPDFKVIARSSVFRFKGKEIEPQKVAQDLKVRALVMGRIVKRGDLLSVSIELVDSKDNRHLWGHVYERPLSALLEVQQDISKEISESLRSRLSGELSTKVVNLHTSNPQAYQYYLKGLFQLNKRNGDGFKKAVEFFNNAIDVDSNYAPAHAGLAMAYNLQAEFELLPPSEAYPKARAAAQMALKLDDGLAEGHAALASTAEEYDLDFDLAEREFQRAIALNANYADAHHWYGMHLAAMGKFTQAEAEMMRAAELDPLSLIISANVGWVYFCKRDYDAAIDQFNKTLEMDENFNVAHHYLGIAYERKKQYDRALKEFEISDRLAAGGEYNRAQIGHVLAVSGKREEARRVLGELLEKSKTEPVSPWGIALIYTGLEDDQHAIDWLEKAYQARSFDLLYIKVDPRFDRLRLNPRFTQLLTQMRLETSQ